MLALLVLPTTIQSFKELTATAAIVSPHNSAPPSTLSPVWSSLVPFISTKSGAAAVVPLLSRPRTM